jgi:hypothetical protein
MRILWFALVSAAILDGLVTIGLLVIWLIGVDGLMFRALHIVIQPPLLIILLNVIQLIIVVVAMFVTWFTGPPNESTLIQLDGWLHR